MTLSALIRKRNTGNLATAIPAISATQPKGGAATVARIATVAVAIPKEEKTAPPANDGDKHVDKLLDSFVWLIHFADRDTLKVTFSPAVTQAEALAGYPDALAAEPIATAPKRTATTDEATELKRLIEAVYRDDTESDRREALDTALADPEPALICYRAIALERGITPADPDDDRRTCR